MKFKTFYEKNYKALMIFPVLLLVLAMSLITVQTIQTGDFVNKGVSLSGGSTISVQKITSAEALEETLRDAFPTADISVRAMSGAGTQTGITIDSAYQSEGEMGQFIDFLKPVLGVQKEDLSIEITGSALGQSFFRQTFYALIIAFVMMGLVVFLYFRTIIPSLAVILSAFSDIVVVLAVFNMTGMKLTTAGVAAFLMLIGYSVDTDILLTNRMLKGRDLYGDLMDALKTGLTMSMTTTSAVFIALIVAQSDVLKQIMLIVFIGLIVDLIYTWFLNAGILRMYLEGRK